MSIGLDIHTNIHGIGDVKMLKELVSLIVLNFSKSLG